MSSSPADARVIPPQARQVGLTQAFVYNGASMAPTFRPGQLLYVRPVARDLAPGDVVVFANSSGSYVVHRVVTATDAGLVTRGDSNRLPDVLSVAHGQVVGRVELAEYAGRLNAVSGGRYGLLRVHLLHARLSMWETIKKLGKRPYRWLRTSGLVARYWHPRITRLSFNGKEELPVKYVCKGRTVARFWPASGRFECRKPFDLVIPRPDGPDMPQLWPG
jgi:signal peptidase I